MIFTDALTTILNGITFGRITAVDGAVSYTVDGVGVGRLAFEEQVIAAYERSCEEKDLPDSPEN